MTRSFEYLWYKCAGKLLILFLSFDDLLELADTFPSICDSLFYDGCPLHKRFFRRFWFRLALDEQDFVRTHDCFEGLYKFFSKWRHAPSTSVLRPCFDSGLYPYEPYLAWRLCALFLSEKKSSVRMVFVPNIHVQSLVSFPLQTPQMLVIWHGDHDPRSALDFPMECLGHMDGQYMTVSRHDILAIVFEVLLIGDLQLYGAGVNEDEMIVSEHGNHTVEILREKDIVIIQKN